MKKCPVVNHGIRVLVIDSYNEFNFDVQSDIASFFTVCPSDIGEAFASFVKSDVKTLLQQLGSKPQDISKAEEEIKEWANKGAFTAIEGVRIKRNSLTTSGKDKVIKNVLDDFVMEWFPHSYLMEERVEEEDINCSDLIIVLWTSANSRSALTG